jgi:predicted methyltransferase
MGKRVFLAAAAVACGLPALAFGADAAPAGINAAINSIARTTLERALDAERKPAEVLRFSEVKPGDVVAEVDDPFYELAPGDTFATGFTYWLHLISMSVGKQGHLYAMTANRGFRGANQMRAAMAQAAAAAGKPKPFFVLGADLTVEFETEYKNVKAMSEVLENFGGDFAIPEQADLVFLRDTYHSFHNAAPSYGKPLLSKPYDMREINRTIYRGMKPGAVLLISDFAAAPGAGFSVTDTLKRSDPEAVKAEVIAAGFEFVGASDALANPADDHSKSAAGLAHPDQFLLKFRKPRNAPATDWRPKGAVFTRWQKDHLENTMENLTAGSPPGAFYSGQWYHGDGLLEEHCCGLFGPFVNGGVLLSTYFWDSEGHVCQYFEQPADPVDPPGELWAGDANCEGFESPEQRYSYPGGYAWADMIGFLDVVPGTKIVGKGIIYPTPHPANPADFPPRPKSNTIPLGPEPGKIWGEPALPNPPGLTDFYCRIEDSANATAYFSNVILGDFSQAKRYATAFDDFVHSRYAGSQGSAACMASSNDFRQTRAKEDIERAADDKKSMTRQDTGWYWTLDGAYAFR